MNTTHIHHLINDYIDGELTPEQRRTVEEHLVHCAACSAELRSMQALVNDLHRLPRSIAPPADLLEGMPEKLAGIPNRSENLEHRKNGAAHDNIVPLPGRRIASRIGNSSYFRAAAAVIVLALAGLTSWLMFRSPGNEVNNSASQVYQGAPKEENSLPNSSSSIAAKTPSQGHPEEIEEEIEGQSTLPGKIMQEPQAEEHLDDAAVESRELTQEISPPAQPVPVAGTITGTVRDSATGAPLANAAVYIPGTTLGVFTDAEGKYTLGGLPAGEYKLRSGAEGYIAANQGTIRVESQKRITRDVMLSSIDPPREPGTSAASVAQAKPSRTDPIDRRAAAPAEPRLAMNAQGQSGKIVGKITDAATGEPIPNVNVLVVGTTRGAITDFDGKYTIMGVPVGIYTVRASLVGYQLSEVTGVKVAADRTLAQDFALNSTAVEMKGVTVSADMQMVNSLTTSGTQTVDAKAIEQIPNVKDVQDVVSFQAGTVKGGKNIYLRGGRANTQQEMSSEAPMPVFRYPGHEFHTEEYDRIYENEFLDVVQNPLSTFSIDVDAASYSNLRRFIENGQLPPPDAVRIEEMINYFSYEYPQPRGEHPFSITTEVAACPWNTENKLVLIGLQGKKIVAENLPPSNLVFLLDVSGSMNAPNKLPFVKSAFRLLIDQLRDEDRVSIVVYAGRAGLVLPSTPGSRKQDIRDALDDLTAGGSTAGGEGIHLAYKVAKENFIDGGNNRVILATDGDFNVGVSSDAELVRLIEEKRDDGIFLSVLGFGEGNYKDAKMQQLADKGNGNHSYIDNIMEAKKVFVRQMAGTLFTIAKDVKLQLEFNPARVKAYRLIGYENRLLAKEDFNDDRKDAGELGAGHTVTALYEIVPVSAASEFVSVDSLKYQRTRTTSDATTSRELLTVKFRYKRPDERKSNLIVQTLNDRRVSMEDASNTLRFASAVAEFGMLLRDSKFKGTSSYGDVLEHARDAKGSDREGYRAEFIRLVEMAELLGSKK